MGVDLDSEKLKLIEIKETPYLTDIFHAIHFVYAAVIGEDDKILLNFNCDNESEEYKWFDLKKLPDKTIDSKEHLIELSIIAKDKFLEEGKIKGK